jgi:hypothetical protein
MLAAEPMLLSPPVPVAHMLLPPPVLAAEPTLLMPPVPVAQPVLLSPPVPVAQPVPAPPTLITWSIGFGTPLQDTRIIHARNPKAVAGRYMGELPSRTG